MEDKNNNDEIANKKDLNEDNDRKNSIKEFNFTYELSISLVLNQILQYIEKDDMKNLYLSNKKIYDSYCSQVKQLKLRPDIEKISNINFDKYNNLYELNLSESFKIKDYSFIIKLKKL